MTRRLDPERALEVAVEAARAGGRVLTRTDRRELEIELKDARVDVTTSADRASQDAVVAVLEQAYPQHAIVGEEGSAGGPDADHVWYVDALDGTSNYAHGVPWYCVSVGLRCRGPTGSEVVAGAVYDPVHEELFAAARGRGATCNGEVLRVSPVDRLDKALVVSQAQSADPAVIREFVELFEAMLHNVAGVRFPGAPALILSHIAAGHFTAYCERHMDAWDLTAGQLILEEAGGRVTDFAGRRLDSADRTAVVASNGPIHDALLAVLPAQRRPEGRLPVVRPIGRVESPLVDRGAAPKQGDEGSPDAWLVFESDVAEGIRDLEVGSEIEVLTWLDRAHRDVLVTRPRDDPRNPIRGVFSTRSPDRPNPVGLHPVRILAIDGLRIRVGNLEALDGTPIVDVKPVLDPRRAAR